VSTSTTEMIDRSALGRAMIVGTALQVVLAVLADWSNWIQQHALLFGAMMLSAIAGYLYAQDVSKGYLAGATGGLVAGGVSGLFGVAVSVILGDTDPGLFVQNTLIFVLTGGVGGLFGQMAAAMEPPGRR
jgi:hypothetical protein